MMTAEQQQLLDKFADLSDALFEEGVISTDSFTGEIGEYIACRHFKLQKTARVSKAVDGICAAGNRYQVKSQIVSSDRDAFFAMGLKPNLFDYLVLVYLDNFYNPVRLIRLPSSTVPTGRIRVSSSKADAFEQVSGEQIDIPRDVSTMLNEFAKTSLELQQKSITRSKRVVGDIGEFYACKRLNLQLCDDQTEKGIDARNSDGLTFEIKTRRVYKSGRRVSETRRLNNLVGKNADFLVVVAIDRSFKCAGMWVMPMKNLVNPKSANLKVVNTTVGVLNLFPSQIPWLHTGEAFVSFEQYFHDDKR